MHITLNFVPGASIPVAPNRAREPNIRHEYLICIKRQREGGLIASAPYPSVFLLGEGIAAVG
jgi:hypothetical protein